MIHISMAAKCQLNPSRINPQNHSINNQLLRAKVHAMAHDPYPYPRKQYAHKKETKK